jgi:hypothetical protein
MLVVPATSINFRESGNFPILSNLLHLTFQIYEKKSSTTIVNAYEIQHLWCFSAKFAADKHSCP